MTEHIFMMGQFEAKLPDDRRYTPNHLWFKLDEEDRSLLRVGFTAYSVRLLQDVYFLDWEIDAPSNVSAKQRIGEVESSKAVSALHAPFAGEIVSFNEALLDDPSAINTDGYGDGYLYTYRGDFELMTVDDYVTHLESEWERTQKVIKGQVNQ